ncbi:TetR/AcrR family transcriptional regulator [Mycolicibacterium austroafricanum]|uniref:TetR/AcrR family transcriptional regulator n=1 Tax=Mycolicibacterium austroafricanum TaxID=39687 RepID=A0ABT8HH34_MYCAO|nr:TetR/AcrR family transcriptional regulator [Mycolicibacterium austroafricanum]MDN4520058.1 TetR/AcrR family transcriptional regulator [Mycolicibacterium austroafricanum]QRZ06067.1 TetR/AcrR family transcriptional regulator [Mycolicibacterium austroafricanum]QZT67552.1 TetR/AcrR family transcriptional regulator [Mycolicibacterium austroafricanum]
MAPQVRQTARELRRLQTRERILGAAIAEFQASGMAGADIGAIVSAAGVAHGTFFFHFPSKEHVLLELERREESRMATEFARYLDKKHDLASALAKVVELISALERRFGPLLFKELLALHFSPTRPSTDEWSDHPVIVSLVGAIERARGDGEIQPEVDAFYSAAFFLLGIYGVLTTVARGDIRDAMLANLITTARRGLETR